MVDRIFKSEEMYLEILESIGDAVIVTNVNGDIFFMNGIAEKLSKWSKNEALGKPIELIFNIINEHTREPVENPIRKVLKEGHVVGLANHTILIGKDGTEITIADSGAIVKDKDGKILGTVLIFRDITERKKAEQKLKESEEKYKNLSNELEIILDLIPGLIFCKDRNGIWTRVNQNLAEFLSMKKEDIIGKTSFDLFPEEQARKFREDDLEVINSGIPKLNIEESVDTPSGKTWAIMSKVPQFNEEGKTIGVIGLAIDITERREIEQKLRESEEKFRIIAENSLIGIVIIQNNTIIYVNETLAKMFGYSTQEIMEWPVKKMFSAVHPDDRHIAIQRFKAKKKGELEVSQSYLYRIITKSGKIKWIENYSNVILYLGKDAILASIVDITETKKAEQKLRESEEKLKKFMDSATDSFILLDAKLNCVDFNKKTEIMLGLNKEEVIGKNILDIVPNYRETGRFDKYLEVIKTGKPIFIDDLIPHPRFGDIHLAVSAFKVGGGLGIITTDITERKKAELKLRESEANYRRAFNRAEFYKDLFAHDINNILQSVLTAVDINLIKLRKLKNSKDLLEINHSIKEQVIRGAKLVSNIRKLSLIEEQEIKLQPINFIKILKKSINFIKKSYKHQQIEIQVNQEENLPNINANDFLEDVFENILLNAVKYTQNLKKEILIKISKEKKKELNYVKMEFFDNGIGIPDLIKEKIFNRSYNEGRSVGGLGLGLSLVKKIVETYKGHIWVENKIKDDHSKGSNFVLLLPEGGF